MKKKGTESEEDRRVLSAASFTATASDSATVMKKTCDKILFCI